jgi:hypothetical protein
LIKGLRGGGHRIHLFFAGGTIRRPAQGLWHERRF